MLQLLPKPDQAALSGFGQALLSGCFPSTQGEDAAQIGRATRAEAALTELYVYLPVRLPPLYERLILEYCWPEIEVGPLRLLANPPGGDLSGLLREMKRDTVFWEELVPRGWVPFGKGPDLCYDPVCFDLRKRTRVIDCRVVQLDHEALLCHSRVREVVEVAPSFRSLLERLTTAVHPFGARRDSGTR